MSAKGKLSMYPNIAQNSHTQRGFWNTLLSFLQTYFIRKVCQVTRFQYLAPLSFDVVSKGSRPRGFRKFFNTSTGIRFKCLGASTWSHFGPRMRKPNESGLGVAMTRMPSGFRFFAIWSKQDHGSGKCSMLCHRAMTSWAFVLLIATAGSSLLTAFTPISWERN